MHILNKKFNNTTWVIIYLQIYKWHVILHYNQTFHYNFYFNEALITKRANKLGFDPSSCIMNVFINSKSQS